MTRTLILLFAAALPQARGTPEVFAPGVISTAALEYAITFAPSGDTAYFTRRSSFRDAPRLWSATRGANDAWTDAGPVSFSRGDGDEYPSLSRDGQRLFFASRRRLPSDSAPVQVNRMWMSRIVAGRWSEPEIVVPAGWEGRMGSHPVEAADGTLYFHSRRPDGAGGVDAYRATRAGATFGAPEVLTINSPATDGEVVLWPDLTRLVFYSERDSGVGGGDLYISRRAGTGWGPPVNAGPDVNSTETEWTPSLSPDGRRLFFARLNQARTQSDIYVVDFAR